MTTLILIKIVENKGAMLNETSNTGCINSEDQLTEYKKAAWKSFKNTTNYFFGKS
jgi:hypothetical protein